MSLSRIEFQHHVGWIFVLLPQYHTALYSAYYIIMLKKKSWINEWKEEWINGLDGQQQLRIRSPKSNYPHEASCISKESSFLRELRRPTPSGVHRASSTQRTMRLAVRCPGAPRYLLQVKSASPSPALCSGFSPGKWPGAGTAIHRWWGTQCLDRGLENTGTVRTTRTLRGECLALLSLKMRDWGQEESRSHSG